MPVDSHAFVTEWKAKTIDGKLRILSIAISSMVNLFTSSRGASQRWNDVARPSIHAGR